MSADGERVRTAASVLTAADCGHPVTNNVTELLGLVSGLEALPAAWCGTVYSDSWVSLQRLFLAAKLHGVPLWLMRRLHAIQRSGRLARMAYVLLDGHPTRAELAAGIGKRGHGVSIHNVWCDQQCSAIARERLQQ